MNNSAEHTDLATIDNIKETLYTVLIAIIISEKKRWREFMEYLLVHFPPEIISVAFFTIWLTFWALAIGNTLRHNIVFQSSKNAIATVIVVLV